MKDATEYLFKTGELKRVGGDRLLMGRKDGSEFVIISIGASEKYVHEIGNTLQVRNLTERPEHLRKRPEVKEYLTSSAGMDYKVLSEGVKAFKKDEEGVLKEVPVPSTIKIPLEVAAQMAIACKGDPDEEIKLLQSMARLMNAGIINKNQQNDE